MAIMPAAPHWETFKSVPFRTSRLPTKMKNNLLLAYAAIPRSAKRSRIPARRLS